MTRGNAIPVDQRSLASVGTTTARLHRRKGTRPAARQAAAARIWIGVTAAACLMLLVLRMVGTDGFPSLVVITAFVVAVGWAAIALLLAPPPERSTGRSRSRTIAAARVHRVRPNRG